MAYKARTITGAQARVRQLERLLQKHSDLIDQYARERRVLAKLAADEPMFHNPIDVWEAKRLRDLILKNLSPRERLSNVAQ